MGDENEEIDGTYDAVAGEFGVAVKVVIGDVADEEERGEDCRAEHETFVNGAIVAADVEIAEDQTDGAERVEEGVGGGEDGDPIGGGDPAFEIDEPNQKCRNDGAEADDSRQRFAGEI